MMSEIQEDTDNPVHLLLIAPSKVGKSTYCAEAARDGFHLIYLDSDNGRSAIHAFAQKNNVTHVLDNINYFRLTHPSEFLRNLLNSSTKRPFVWMPNRNVPFATGVTRLPDAKPEEEAWVMAANLIPASAVMVVDSWTSVTQEQLGQLRPDQNQPLLNTENKQAVYGEAKNESDFICNVLQAAPYHVIVQAHSTRYEIYEKPAGSTNAKQKEFKLLETIEVPVATSNPSGLAMAKRFNHIGLLSVQPTSEVMIDFRRYPDKVSGGPPGVKDLTSKLTFKKLVTDAKGRMPLPTDDYSKWFIKTTYAEIDSAVKEIKSRSL
jgi:hypothetical protein